MLARKIRNVCSERLSRFRVVYFRFMGVTIGKKCYISRHAHIDVGGRKITIGNRVSIAGGSYILAHAAGYRPKEGQETRIEDNVRIFVNAVIMPGITVGKNSIVGAGAVVIKNIPPNVTVMGNPARITWPKGNKPKD